MLINIDFRGIYTNVLVKDKKKKNIDNVALFSKG